MTRPVFVDDEITQLGGVRERTTNLERRPSQGGFPWATRSGGVTTVSSTSPVTFALTRVELSTAYTNDTEIFELDPSGYPDAIQVLQDGLYLIRWYVSYTSEWAAKTRVRLQGPGSNPPSAIPDMVDAGYGGTIHGPTRFYYHDVAFFNQSDSGTFFVETGHESGSNRSCVGKLSIVRLGNVLDPVSTDPFWRAAFL